MPSAGNMSMEGGQFNLSQELAAEMGESQRSFSQEPPADKSPTEVPSPSALEASVQQARVAGELREAVIQVEASPPRPMASSGKGIFRYFTRQNARLFDDGKVEEDRAQAGARDTSPARTAPKRQRMATPRPSQRRAPAQNPKRKAKATATQKGKRGAATPQPENPEQEEKTEAATPKQEENPAEAAAPEGADRKKTAKRRRARGDQEHPKEGLKKTRKSGGTPEGEGEAPEGEGETPEGEGETPKGENPGERRPRAKKRRPRAKERRPRAKGKPPRANGRLPPAKGLRPRAKARAKGEEKVDDTVVSMEADFPELAVELKCARCGSKLDPSRAVITGKAAGVWRCNLCNTRGVQLARLPGWQGFAGILRGRFWR